MRGRRIEAGRWTSSARRTRLPALLVLLLSTVAASALHAELDVPYLSGPVVDLADLIPPDAEARITERILALESATGAQIAVLTVPSLEGDSLEAFTIRVVDTWQLGQEDSDNGALLFVARDERRLRIEVGYGLEGLLTDAMSGRILDNVVTPAFRQGDFGGGVERAVDSMIALVGGEGEPPAEVARDPGDSFDPGGCVMMIFILIVFVILPMMRRARYGSGWSSRRGGAIPWIITTGGGLGGGRSGGFGGFSGGGGGFGGGGASGGW